MEITDSAINEYEEVCSFENLFTNLENLLVEGMLEDKKIVLFGASWPSREIVQYLRQKQYTVHAVIDNNKAAVGTDFEGITVTSPKEELGEFQDNVVVFIVSSHYREMREQLENISDSEQGYVYGKHIFDLIDYDKIVEKIYSGIPEEGILSLDEIKEESLIILKYFKQVCEENHLTYFLCYGTLLGAIRHQGFIPWDDDIDVAMPYGDYKKMLEIVEKEGKYVIRNNETCKSYKPGFTKLLNPMIYRQVVGFPIYQRHHLNIDIFPLYSVPDDEEERRRILDTSKELKAQIDKWSGYGNLDKYIREKEALISMWENIGYGNTKDVFSICTISTNAYGGFIFPHKLFDSTIEKKFCDEYFSVPSGYDEMLKILFSDYMTLPPENERGNHSHGVCYRDVETGVKRKGGQS